MLLFLQQSQRAVKKGEYETAKRHSNVAKSFIAFSVALGILQAAVMVTVVMLQLYVFPRYSYTHVEAIATKIHHWKKLSRFNINFFLQYIIKIYNIQAYYFVLCLIFLISLWLSICTPFLYLPIDASRPLLDLSDHQPMELEGKERKIDG